MEAGSWKHGARSGRNWKGGRMEYWKGFCENLPNMCKQKHSRSEKLETQTGKVPMNMEGMLQLLLPGKTKWEVLTHGKV